MFRTLANFPYSYIWEKRSTMLKLVFKRLPTKRLVFGPSGAGDPWSLFLFLYMGERIHNARTDISSVCPQFLISDPLPRIYEVDSDILVFCTLGTLFLFLYMGESIHNARTGISSICPQFLTYLGSIPRF